LNWQNNVLNFDNIFSAVITVFYLCIGDGWVEIMYTCIDANGIDYEPKRDANLPALAFVLGVVLIGQFILINMFIGVVVDSYARECVAVGDMDDDTSYEATPSSPRKPSRAWDTTLLLNMFCDEFRPL
jgi:hypothetical protein